MSNESIYLDYNATTPVVDPEVIDSIIKLQTTFYANPSSYHIRGQEAKQLIVEARSSIAKLINCEPEELFFTSGGTESNNWALKGVAFSQEEYGKHIITSSIEHPAIVEPLEYLNKKFGFEVTKIPVNDVGLIDLIELENSIRVDNNKTIMVSIMHSNNEVGTIEPIKEISNRIKNKNNKIIIHCDASQSIGKVKIDVKEMNIDLLTIAAHKCYAPKGIGCLFIKKNTPIEKFMHGASHESGFRSGTENSSSIVALGESCKLLLKNFEVNVTTMKNTRNLLYKKLVERIPGIVNNTPLSISLPNTLSVSFPNINATELMHNLKDKLCFSTGAACHSNKSASLSTTLVAMKKSKDVIIGTIRLSTGKTTTEEEIEKAVDLLVNEYNNLLKLSQNQ